MVLARLIRRQRVAALGTLRKGAPMVTMIAYAAAADFTAFYLHISRLAMHTQNILKHDRVSLLIFETDGDMSDPQRLARVSISGVAEALPPGSTELQTAREIYLQKYPAAQINFQLGDFSIYRVAPAAGRFVAGFGKIFNITPGDLGDAAAAGEGEE